MGCRTRKRRIQRCGRKYTISAYRFGDATGALAAFDQAVGGCEDRRGSRTGAANASDEVVRLATISLF